MESKTVDLAGMFFRILERFWIVLVLQNMDWYWKTVRLQKTEHYGSLLLIQRAILADYFISTNRPESKLVHESARFRQNILAAQ